ncbi:MAG: M6 family metalloprotease domain-containing protein [bacterium]|nr:M6 family metalloprotease domain-containing protein [bacterium]
MHLIFRLGFTVVLTMGILGLSYGMPPSPELLERIREGSITQPYFLINENHLRNLGVEQPVQVRWQRNADEIDTTYFPSILLLVDFVDQPFQTSASFFDSLMYGNSVGKVRHYFREISREQLYITTFHPPSMVGWIRAPQLYSYYTNGQNGFGTYPQNAQRMVEDAILLANPFVDFSQYDFDGDNIVDGLMVVHSGPGAELTGNNNHIWSHAWNLPNPVNVDGVTIQNYNTVPEYWVNPNDMTCGVFAHEMGHSFFGLPDLYDTDYSSEGLGSWSLMAGGSWNGQRGNSPAHPDAYCKIAMGVTSSINVTTTLSNQQIPAVQTSGIIYRLWRNGTLGSQYFLLENRQRIGYDAALPADGLLIYHIDRTVSHNRNEWYPGRTSSGHYRVALEQADGRWDLERNVNSGDAGDPYPGTSYNRNFNTSTTPNSRSYSNTSTQVGILGISNSGPVMTADLMVNGASIVMETPNGGEFYAVGSRMTIEWAPSGITGSKTIEINRNYPNGPWELIHNNVTAESIFVWTITGDTTSQARIRVRTNTMNPAVSGVSDENFSIGYGTITLTRPNGNELFTAGNRHAILWNQNGIVGTVRLEIDRNYPSGNWEVIGDSVLSSPYSWLCTGPATQNARVRVRTLEMAVEIADTSDANFSIRVLNIEENGETNIPQQFDVMSIHPNPFNSTTRIVIHNEFRLNYQIAVYSVEGKLIRELTGNREQKEILLNADGLPSGTYYLVLISNHQIIEQKTVVLLK